MSSMFHEDKLKKIANFMAGDHGIEKTPAEWEAEFHNWIKMVREEQPIATQGWSDDEVWQEIVRQVRNL